MSILSILKDPDPRLRQISAVVPEVTDEIRGHLKDMMETMYHADGIGLAAPQVNIFKRLVVMDTGSKLGPVMMVNPELVVENEVHVPFKEGCLSVPDRQSWVKRPKKVRVSYWDENGTPQEHSLSGLDAVCIQHEIDHLNGILFIDHLEKNKK